MKTIELDKIWLTDTEIWIRTIDGREAKENLSDYPRLFSASKDQLLNYTIGTDGIHWLELDEDLSFEAFFENKNRNVLYRFFMSHPEINPSAVARRLGISQAVFAQYISAKDDPNISVLDRIREEIVGIGLDLMVPSF